MKISLEITQEIVSLNGTPVRVWEGKTDSGIKIFALIAAIGVHESEDQSQFKAFLHEFTPLVLDGR